MEAVLKMVGMPIWRPKAEVSVPDIEVVVLMAKSLVELIVIGVGCGRVPVRRWCFNYRVHWLRHF